MKRFLSFPRWAALFSCAAFSLVPASQAANYYWVGGSGDWSDHANHWATSSGGAVFHALVPNPTDDVFFDANSFTAPGQTVTLIAESYCNDFTVDGAAHAPTIDGDTFILNVAGDLNIQDDITYNHAGRIRLSGSITLSPLVNWNHQEVLEFNSAAAETIDFGGASSESVSFTGSGSWTLQSSLNVLATGTLEVRNGTLISNGLNIFAGADFNTSFPAAKTVDFTGSSTVTCSRNWKTQAANTTLVLDGVEIIVQGDGDMNFFGGGQDYTGSLIRFDNSSSALRTIRLRDDSTYGAIMIDNGGRQKVEFMDQSSYGDVAVNYAALGVSPPQVRVLEGNTFGSLNITVSGDATPQLDLIQENVFGTLSVADGSVLKLWAGRTQTLSDLQLNGICERRITIISSIPGEAGILSQASGTVNGDYLYLKDVTATGGATFNADHSAPFGNVTGWNVTVIPAVTYFWIGGSGDWEDPAHWSTTSGGLPGSGTCTLPTRVDHVVFDANSFTGPGQVVSLNESAECGTMSWAAAANAPTFDLNNQSVDLYGSLILNPAMTLVDPSWFNFLSPDLGNTIDPAGLVFDNVSFDNLDGGWTLAGDLQANILRAIRGSFASGGNELDLFEMDASSSFPKSLDFSGTSLIAIGKNWKVFSGTDLVFNIGSADIAINSDADPVFAGGGRVYNDLSVNSTDTGSATLTIQDHNQLGDVDISAAGRLTVQFKGNTVYGNVSIDYASLSPDRPQVFVNDASTFGDFSLNVTGAMTPILWLKQDNTFGTLGVASGTVVKITPNRTQTVTGLDMVGTCERRIWLESTTEDLVAFVEMAAGSVNTDWLILKDVSVIGGGVFNVDNAVLVGEAMGWNATVLPPENFFWIGGTGVWSDPMSWSHFSGGVPDACGPPTPQDNIFFDVNSFSQPGDVVTLDVDGYGANVVWQDPIGNPVFDGGSRRMTLYGSLAIQGEMTWEHRFILTVRGSMTLGPDTHWNHDNKVRFAGSSVGNVIDTAGHVINTLDIDGNGDWTLGSDLFVDREIIITKGGFTSGGFNVQTLDFNGLAGISNTKNIDFTGTDTILVQRKWAISNLAGTTLNMGTANLSLEAFDATTALTFDGGDRVYNDLSVFHSGTGNNQINFFDDNVVGNVSITTLGGQRIRLNDDGTYNDVTMNFSSGAGNPTVTVVGQNTFNDFSVTSTGTSGPFVTFSQNNTFGNLSFAGVGTRIILGANRTQTVDNFFALGNGSFPVLLNSRTPGTQATISQASGEVCLDYIWLTDINATGGAVFNAGGASQDLGNNTGWAFDSCIAYYWVGGTGDWSDVNHWATASGGLFRHSVPPTQFDTVFFDANSFTGPGQVVTVDVTDARCLDMSWLTSLHNPDFAGASDVSVYGSLTLIPEMSVSLNGGFNFKSNEAENTINAAGQHLQSVSLVGPGTGANSGEWTLANHLHVGVLNHDTGTLNTGDNNIHAQSFNVQTTNARALNLGASVVTIEDGAFNMIETANLAFDAGTSEIVVTSDGGNSDFNGNGATYHDVTFAGPSSQSSLVTGANIYNTLSMGPGSTVSLEAGVTQTASQIVPSGLCNRPVTILSTTPGTQAVLSQASGTVDGLFVRIQDNAAVGGATFNDQSGLDMGNVTGWNFSTLPLLEVTVVATPASCSSQNDGTAFALVSGGTAPYRYKWSNAATTDGIFGLIPGVYSVEVSDSNGCTVMGEAGVSTQLDAGFTPSALSGCVDDEITFSRNPDNTAVRLDGQSERVCAALVGVASNVTFEAWVAPAGDGAALSAQGGANRWGISVVDGNWHVVSFGVLMDTGIPAELDTWQHVAAVYDADSGNVTFYKNASETAVVVGAPNSLGPNFLAMGAESDGNCTGGSVLGGAIDEVRIWNALRSQSEIQLAMGMSLMADEPGLVLYYDCNDGTGSAITTDRTGNGQTGILSHSDLGLAWVDGAPISGVDYLWDFGDGATSTEVQPSHVYTEPGTYVVTLEVTNNLGCFAEASVEIVVSNCCTLALTDISARPETCPGAADGSVDLSITGAAEPASFAWSNGAETEDLEGLEPGVYAVVVTDARGCVIEASVEVGSTPDTENPTITCPEIPAEGLMLETDNNVCGALFTYVVGASDNCGVVLTQTSGLPSGSVFPVGTTRNAFVATDPSGNTADCSFEVTVVDTQKPRLVCPSSLELECGAEGNDALVAAWLESVIASDNCEGLIVTNNYQGLPVGCGDREVGPLDLPSDFIWVEFTAVDAAGNERSCQALIIQADNTPPTIQCPSDVVVDGTEGNCQFVVGNYMETLVTDNCSPRTHIAFTQEPAPGTVLEEGVHKVTLRAVDACGNANFCQFNVIVDCCELCGADCGNGGLTENVLFGVESDAGRLFCMTDYFGDPIGSFVDYGVVKWSDGNHLRTLPEHLESFSINDQGVAYMAYNDFVGELAPPVILTIDLSRLEAGRPVVVDVRGRLELPFRAVSDNISGLANAPGPNGNLFALFAKNDSVDILLEVDPENGSVINDFGPITGLIGEGHHEVRDGEELEFISNGRLVVADNVTDRLYELDPTTGKIIGMLDNNLPGGTQANSFKIEGLAWDGVSERLVATEDRNNILMHVTLGNGENDVLAAILQLGLTDVEGIDFGPLTDGACCPEVIFPEDTSIACGDDPSPAHTGNVFVDAPCCILRATYEDQVVEVEGCREAIHRTWVVRDDCGGSVSHVQVIAVVDAVPPIARCQERIFVSPRESEGGIATLTAEEVDHGSEDACGPVRLSIDREAFTCADAGEVVVTLTVTDACGNQSQCETIVTVRPCQDPEPVCGLVLEAGCNLIMTSDAHGDRSGDGGDDDAEKDGDGDGEADCQGNVLSLVFLYTGESCEASSHSQGKTAICTGGELGEAPISLVYRGKKNHEVSIFPRELEPGDFVTLSADRLPYLPKKTKLQIWRGKHLLQKIQIATDCDTPLAVGDQFGSLLLVAITSTEGGTVTLPELVVPEEECELPEGGAEVLFTYVISNRLDATVAKDVVVEDAFGLVDGSPIDRIEPGETVVLTRAVFLDDAIDNEVRVSANPNAANPCLAVDLTRITRPENDCKECKGGLTSITLVNAGLNEVRYSIYDLSGLIFDGVVQPGEPIELEGSRSDGRFIGKLIVLANNHLQSFIDTSCSREVGPGTYFGSLEVVEATSRRGGLVCPNPGNPNAGEPLEPNPEQDCVDCDEGAVQITFVNEGPDALVVAKDGNAQLFAGVVLSGDSFTVQGSKEDGRFKGFLHLQVNGWAYSWVRTNCSRPIGAGAQFGQFTVSESFRADGGLICPVANCDTCQEGLRKCKLRFVGKHNHHVEIWDRSGPIFAGNIQEDDEAVLHGTRSNGLFDGNLLVFVDGALETVVETRCRIGHGPGRAYGRFLMSEAFNFHGVRICPSQDGEDPDDDDGHGDQAAPL